MFGKSQVGTPFKHKNVQKPLPFFCSGHAGRFASLQIGEMK